VQIAIIGWTHIDFGQSASFTQSTSAKLKKKEYYKKKMKFYIKHKEVNNIQNYLLPLVTTRNREKIINRVKI
jgi:hypothetical protein